MSRKSGLTLFVLILLGSTRWLTGQTPPRFWVTPLACVPPVEKDTNAKIVARIESAAQISSVRVYFHAEGDLFYHSAQGNGLKKDEEKAFFKDPKGQVYFHPPLHEGDHFHEMKRGRSGPETNSGEAKSAGVGEEYWSMLPKIAPGSTEVVYYILVTDAEGHKYSSPLMRSKVKQDCPAPELSDDEKKYAKNLIEGLTAERQSAVPPGFLCDGIVSLITVNGDLKANEECRKCACGFFPVEWVASAALLGGGVVIYNNNRGGGGGRPVSPYRP
jgi:hypothetical protein